MTTERKYRRRVTLHIAYLSGCVRETYPDLVKAIKKIKEDEWDVDNADPEALEQVFARMNGALMRKCIREFEADSMKIRLANGDDCHLCGHPDVRWLFWCENHHESGEGVWMGSSCIHHYSFAVDGEKTAEQALKILQAAVRREEKKIARVEWQEEHPGAKRRIDRLNVFVNSFVDKEVLQRMGPVFLGRRLKASDGWGRIFNYFHKEEFLTETSTKKWKRIEKSCQPLLREYETAVKDITSK